MRLREASFPTCTSALAYGAGGRTTAAKAHLTPAQPKSPPPPPRASLNAGEHVVYHGVRCARGLEHCGDGIPAVS